MKKVIVNSNIIYIIVEQVLKLNIMSKSKTELLKPTETNYVPDSISFAQGFMGPRGDVGYFMHADREKMKSIVKSLIESGRKIINAECGLLGDWGCTVFMEFEEGEWKEVEWGHDNSIWAKPAMIVWFEDSPNEMYECWYKEEKK